MAENERRRSAFIALVRHICHCPQVDIFLNPNHPLPVAKAANRHRFSKFGAEAQKNLRRRAISQIARKMTPLLGAVGLWVAATACGPSVVDLGARGRGVADPGADASAAASGAGGASGGGAAGVDHVGSGEAGSGAAGSGVVIPDGSVANDSGPAVPPDAGGLEPNQEPSTGCGMQPPPITDTNITVGSSTARYLVDPAAGYDPNKPYPLVFSFRSANVRLEAFRRTLDLPGVVGADGIVVNVDCANSAVMWDLQRDPPVFKALLAKLEASYCVDLRRVFVVGHETGAIFANVLACMNPGVLRGLGSLSGVEPQGGACSGGPAVWISQGTSDMTRMLGRDNRDFWIQQNQCDATLSTPVQPAGCLEYTGCAIGGPVRYCEYAGNQDVPSFAASAVWDFFKAL
jgi:polyhydroxybutyrate depolymerase